MEVVSEAAGDLLNLVITIDGQDNDLYLGYDDAGDVGTWRRIAQLWIAAPEMLAACEKMLDSSEDSAMYCEAIDEIGTAIEKAGVT